MSYPNLFRVNEPEKGSEAEQRECDLRVGRKRKLVPLLRPGDFFFNDVVSDLTTDVFTGCVNILFPADGSHFEGNSLRRR